MLPYDMSHVYKKAASEVVRTLRKKPGRKMEFKLTSHSVQPVNSMAKQASRILEANGLDTGYTFAMGLKVLFQQMQNKLDRHVTVIEGRRYGPSLRVKKQPCDSCPSFSDLSAKKQKGGFVHLRV